MSSSSSSDQPHVSGQGGDQEAAAMELPEPVEKDFEPDEVMPPDALQQAPCCTCSACSLSSSLLRFLVLNIAAHCLDFLLLA